MWLDISSIRPGVWAPPPTKNKAAGGLLPLREIISLEIAVAIFSTVGVIDFIIELDSIVFSSPNTSVYVTSSCNATLLFIFSAELKSTKHSWAITSVTSSPAIGTIP